ncbi:MAG: VOC family protein [Actinomyces sp.]|uniref:VOC family protein n=1 Tax=Actinomyces sp. TaxID=29317 RepID=UPI0026DC7644|nr:VOC family protein [Actinomyces sp.]MDO4242463.1 VOC family protein [Actinomyces sp.]
MTQRIVPSLWFDHTALEGARFHVEVFRAALGGLAGGESSTGVTQVSRYPRQGLADFQQEFAGDVLEVRYRLAGFELSAINAGDEFAMDPSLSLAITLDPALVEDAPTRLHALHDGLLADGGRELMALQEYDFAPLYTWVQDRYGMTWQLAVGSHEAQDGSAEACGAVRIVPSLLFDGEDSRAAEALRTWVEVLDRAFGASRLGPMRFYQRQGRQHADSLLHGSAVLAGVPVSAMDNGGEQDFGFSCALSLQVMCDTQEQVDTVWDGLSAVPEAEICGWLRDRFGLSWQVCPANVTELMTRPGAFEVMTTMARPDLSRYEALRDRTTGGPGNPVGDEGSEQAEETTTLE